MVKRSEQIGADDGRNGMIGKGGRRPVMLRLNTWEIAMSSCTECGRFMADCDAREYKNCAQCGKKHGVMHVERPPNEALGRPLNPYLVSYGGRASVDTLQCHN